MRKELEKCRGLQQEISRLSERIENINSMLYSTKGQIISDMPRGNGGATTGRTDDLIDKRDKYIVMRQEAQNDLLWHWDTILEYLRKCEASKEETKMLKYRFFNDRPWKECAKTLSIETNSFWSVDKCFRVYRKLLSKYNKIK